MKNLAKYLKKTPVMLVLAAVLVLPMVVKAYAQENTEQQTGIQVANVDENGNLQNEEPVLVGTATEQQVVETPVMETPEQPLPEAEDPDTTVDADGVTLGEAQVIAQTEHPGSTIKHVKTKVIDGNAVYGFHFEDGWKVYVRASDGVVVQVKDPGNRQHDCKNKLKDNPEFQAWLQNRKEQRKEKHNNRSNDDKDDDDNRSESRSRGRSHRGRED